MRGQAHSIDPRTGPGIVEQENLGLLVDLLGLCIACRQDAVSNLSGY